MQDLNQGFDETDSQPGRLQRFTWHEEAVGRDGNNYDFDEDYRVLEEQYRHDDPPAYEEDANFPR